MKKSLLLLVSIFTLSAASPAFAQEDNSNRVAEIEAQIVELQAELQELKQSMFDNQDTIQFEHEGLSFIIQIEVAPVDNASSFFEDTYVKLHTTVENTTDDPIPFDPGGFNMYLAEVQQTGVTGPADGLERQALPERTTVEGVIYFNVTEAVSNSKDLIVRYQPGDGVFIGDTVFEFKVNEYKRITGDHKEESIELTSSEESFPSETSPSLEEPVDNLGYNPGDYIVTEGYTGFVNPQGEIYEFTEGDQMNNNDLGHVYNHQSNHQSPYTLESNHYEEDHSYEDPLMKELEIKSAEQEWYENFRTGSND